VTAGTAEPNVHSNADPAELGKFDTLAHRFWGARDEFRPLHLLNPLRTQFVVQRAKIEGARVLDVGCGGGLLAETLTNAGARVTAIDLAPAMIEVARSHAAGQALAIDYRVTSAEELARIEGAAFDVVTCMEMLEHVPSPADMVRTLAQLVRPGGQIFLSTINRNLKSFVTAILGAEYLLRLIPRGTHQYERLIRPAELARWGRAAGLELRAITGVSFDPLTERVALTRDPAVNYLAHLERPQEHAT
jgi:2-polyprenyl-6-hydroxyphenyl methylase/3-demethylubiquinone-9 3-methyltransferase